MSKYPQTDRPNPGCCRREQTGSRDSKTSSVKSVHASANLRGVTARPGGQGSTRTDAVPVWRRVYDRCVWPASGATCDATVPLILFRAREAEFSARARRRSLHCPALVHQHRRGRLAARDGGWLHD